MGLVVDLHDVDAGEMLDEKLVGAIDRVARAGGRRPSSGSPSLRGRMTPFFTWESLSIGLSAREDHLRAQTAARRHSRGQLENDYQLTGA